MFRNRFVTVSDVLSIDKKVLWKKCKIYFNYKKESFYIKIGFKRQEVKKSFKSYFILLNE